MRKFSADLVHPIAGAPIPNGVVVTDDAGCVLEVGASQDHDPASVERHPGIIVPGFVNSHCHLELSHLRGMMDTGIGLLSFLQGVVQLRDVPQEEIDAAIGAADAEMAAGGIVAVGDISNTLDTAATKASSSISYSTFVEAFDFMQDDQADAAMERVAAVLEGQSDHGHNRKCLVPHAPYSVSRALFRRIRETNPDTATISIHNQETADEDRLFRAKEGGFLGFYERFGFSLEAFEATGRNSIHTTLANLNPANRVLFVHNTFTGSEDIQAAEAWGDQVSWATCPNANLYIENRLPDYRHWLDAGARMTIGTDSLASNWQLSVLEEMKTIARYQSSVPTETILRWATLNGAEALGFDDRLGSIEIGKTPGLNLLSGLDEGGRLVAATSVRRLI
jgi:cytosine/adenosine deaminase-related metal-dependent hydrolase